MFQSLIKSIDKYKKDLAKNEEDHEDRKRKWDENSSDLDKVRPKFVKYILISRLEMQA